MMNKGFHAFGANSHSLGWAGLRPVVMRLPLLFKGWEDTVSHHGWLKEIFIETDSRAGCLPIMCEEVLGFGPQLWKASKQTSRKQLERPHLPSNMPPNEENACNTLEEKTDHRK